MAMLNVWLFGVVSLIQSFSIASAASLVRESDSDRSIPTCQPHLEFWKALPESHVGSDIPGFRYLFVNSLGHVSNSRGPNGTQIEVAASSGSSQSAIMAAAEVVSKMTRHMPASIFQRLASVAGVGVFTTQEKLVVFPELAGASSGACGTSCLGCCASTCAPDGTKYEDLPGLGGQRAVVVEDNMLCTPRDPFRREHSILSYEFTHTVHNYALPPELNQQISDAFNNAKNNAIWTTGSYAMANDQEYFAQAASVFFGINKDPYVSGGMNLCDGASLCGDEQDARNNLQHKDPALFSVLSHVFTTDRPHLPSGMSICP